MDTKRITQWMLSNKDAQQIGVDASFEKMVMHLEETIQKEIIAFVNNVTVTGEDRPLVNALNNCFNEVESEFNSDRWVNFGGDIYFDKQAKGFWMLCEAKVKAFNKGSPFNSGQSYNDVIEIINSELKDDFNEWDVPNLATLRLLTVLSSL